MVLNLSDDIIKYATALLMIIAVVIKTVETIMCGYLLEETENIGSSKCKFIKQTRLKFENSCKLNSDMRNVEAFVKRHINKYKPLNISLQFLEIFERVIKQLIVIMAVGEFIFDYYNGSSFETNFIHIAFAFGAILMIRIAETILDCDYKKDMVIINFVDFFDNTIMNRLKYERNILEEEELQRDNLNRPVDPSNPDEMVKIKEDLQMAHKKYDAEVIQDILNEFFA